MAKLSVAPPSASAADSSTDAHLLGALAQRLHAALPQTQCQRCGYVDCAAYASAIAAGTVAINQCPPGGEEGVRRLSAISVQAVLPLNPNNGQEGPRLLAHIDLQACIGCTLCLKPCPTDAIVGAAKFLHQVLPQHCTGCELCVPLCPVDCITMVAVGKGDTTNAQSTTAALTGWAAWSEQQAGNALSRYQHHCQRLGVSAQAMQVRPSTSTLPSTDTPANSATESTLSTSPGQGAQLPAGAQDSTTANVQADAQAATPDAIQAAVKEAMTRARQRLGKPS